MEEVITSFDKILLLTEEETDVVPIGDVDEDEVRKRLKIALVGKVLTTESFNLRATNLGENLFLFIFATEVDCKRVLRNGPWNFDKALVLLEEPNCNIAPSRMVFKFAEFWVQIHNVPLLGMTVQTGRH
ncbi:hypothetical protein ACE6H2_007103 [Prunus campanulata]